MRPSIRFSALQRAEIAEILSGHPSAAKLCLRFSALQRAEIAEILRTLPEH